MLPASASAIADSRAAASVRDITVAQNLLRQAVMAVQRYADPAWRETGLIAFADAVHSMLQGAEPGSDRQLAYAQALGRTAISHAHLALLAGLLEGTISIDGLFVNGVVNASSSLTLPAVAVVPFTDAVLWINPASTSPCVTV